MEGRRPLGAPPGRLEQVTDEIAEVLSKMRLMQDRQICANRHGDEALERGYAQAAERYRKRLLALEEKVRDAGRLSA